MGQKNSTNKSDTNNNQSVSRLLKKVSKECDSNFVNFFRPSKFDEIIDNAITDDNVSAKYSWNPEDCSRNVYVLPDDPFTFHRHPIARSTDSIRGKLGFSNGFHVWQIKWNSNQRGTHAVVGVCTTKAPLNVDDYTILVGANKESWGWDIIRQKIYHDSKEVNCWYPTHSSDDYEVSDTITVILDMDAGTLAFADNGRYLGVAVDGLRGKTLFPTVSTVWGHVEISIKYIGGLARKFSFMFNNILPFLLCFLVNISILIALNSMQLTETITS
ncbi:hypothetical protein B4U80_03518 [Leptotrombidium deliense]|uniref:B30.2/SPRY domain-containing protein n=1 Tax=Leptotrombidium deliense TaxID=299467 RepID=A0A443SJ04_9ACAR|nr:hypothetical protein B4U80_03518 [Leptotrombidium deliense]